jgi:hypothetical protein
MDKAALQIQNSEIKFMYPGREQSSMTKPRILTTSWQKKSYQINSILFPTERSSNNLFPGTSNRLSKARVHYNSNQIIQITEPIGNISKQYEIVLQLVRNGKWYVANSLSFNRSAGNQSVTMKINQKADSWMHNSTSR